MTRPLLISDCDEVLLHMVRHFADWLGEAHEIDFTIGSWELAKSMKRRNGGPALTQEEMFGFLGGFFPAEMARQTLVPGAKEALTRLSETADVVILTKTETADSQKVAALRATIRSAKPVSVKSPSLSRPVPTSTIGLRCSSIETSSR